MQADERDTAEAEPEERREKLTRLVHSNFTEGDIALHLTYRPGEEPQTEEEAQHILSNYIRRLKRRYAKLGLELKYISCTEYRKDRTAECTTMSLLSGGLDRDTIEKVWGWAMPTVSGCSSTNPA